MVAGESHGQLNDIIKDQILTEQNLLAPNTKDHYGSLHEKMDKDKLISSSFSQSLETTDDIKQDHHPLFPSFRLGVSLSCMCIATLILLQQTSMTAAIVLMDTNHPGDESEFGGNKTAPRPLNRTKLHLIQEDKWAISWSPEIKSLVVAMFFFGYYISHLPTAYLVTVFGPKRIGLIGLLASSLLQIFTVQASFLQVELLLCVRFLTGLSSGMMYGPAFDLMARWTPKDETSILFGIVGAGLELGSPLCFLMSLIITKINLGGKWLQVFYIQGICGLLMFTIFLIILSDSPNKNRFVSLGEGEYIDKHRAPRKESRKIPLTAMLRSKALWASMVAQLGADWMANVVNTQFPLYHSNILKLDQTQVNTLGSAPLSLAFVFLPASGHLADLLIRKHLLSRSTTRKIFNGGYKIIAISVCIGLCFLQKGSFGMCFLLNALLAIGLGMTNGGGYIPNQGEIAPSYTAFVCSFCQTGAMWVGFVVPILFGQVTVDNTNKQWQTCLGTTAGILMLTLAFFTAFASGEIQPWARDEDDDKKLKKDIIMYNT